MREEYAKYINDKKEVVAVSYKKGATSKGAVVDVVVIIDNAQKELIQEQEFVESKGSMMRKKIKT